MAKQLKEIVNDQDFSKVAREMTKCDIFSLGVVFYQLMTQNNENVTIDINGLKKA